MNFLSIATLTNTLSRIRALSALILAVLGLSIGAAAIAQGLATPPTRSHQDSVTIERVKESLPTPLQQAIEKLQHPTKAPLAVFKIDEFLIDETPAQQELSVLDSREDSYIKMSSTCTNRISDIPVARCKSVIITLNTEVLDKSKLQPGHVGLQGKGLAEATDATWSKMPEELRKAIKAMKDDHYTIYNAVIPNAVVLEKVVPVTSRSRFQTFLQVRTIGILYSETTSPKVVMTTWYSGYYWTGYNWMPTKQFNISDAKIMYEELLHLILPLDKTKH
jgi:hypothetical protein